MKLLVLGATGMLGSGVCHSLRQEGFEVHGTFRNKTHNICLNLELDKMIKFDVFEIYDFFENWFDQFCKVVSPAFRYSKTR